MRSLAFAVAFYGNLLVWMVIGVPFALAPGRSLAGVLRGWARTNLWLLRVIVGTRAQFRGFGSMPSGGAIVAAKHQSAWETFALFAVLDDPCFVLKKELLDLPVFGWYARRAGMIAVDRSAGASALRALARQARPVLAAGRPLVIFPEGTRQPVDATPAYRSGIALLYGDLAVPCVPVALNAGLYWARKGLVRRPGTILVEALPAIEPGLPRAPFMAALETAIETATGRLVAEGRARDGGVLGAAP